MGKVLDDLVIKYNRKFNRDYNSESIRGTSVSEDWVIKNKRRLWHYYSDLLDIAEKAKELEEELFKDLPKEIAEEVLKAEAEGDSGEYRYKVLPKLFSNLFSNNGEISCSPNLRRKLISYYIRNRRKVKRMFRGYSNQQSVDYILHNVYMELGKTLYFSFLDRIKGIRNKIREYIRIISSIFSVLFESAPSGLGYKEKFNYSLSYLTLGSIFLYQQFNPHDSFHILLIIVLVVTGGFLASFLLAGLGMAFQGTIIGTLIEIILMIIYGLFQIMIAIKDLISMGIAELIALVIKAMQGDTENEKFKEEVRELLSASIKGKEFLKIVKGDSNILKDAKLKSVMVSMIAKTNKDIGNIILKKAKKKLDIPSVVGFKVSKVVGKDLQVASDIDDVPPSIKALLMLTSPKIQITIEADGHIIEAEFKALECFKKYGIINDNPIAKFVSSYLGIRTNIDDEVILNMLAEGQSS